MLPHIPQIPPKLQRAYPNIISVRFVIPTAEEQSPGNGGRQTYGMIPPPPPPPPPDNGRCSWRKRCNYYSTFKKVHLKPDTPRTLAP